MAFSASYDNPAAPGTGAAVSNREDLTSLLTQLDPVSTPVTSLSPKRKARATLHEWTVDGLAAVDHTGLFEGADVSSFSDKFTNRARLGNVCQGFRRDFMVSQVQQAVESVQTNTAAARTKCLREIKRDVEGAITSADDRQTGSGAQVAVLRGLHDWCSSTAPADVPTIYATPAAQNITTVTESNLNNALASMFNISGTLSSVTAVCDTAVRIDISEFMRLEASYSGAADTTDRTRYNVSGSGKAVYMAVDFYYSDFGTIKVTNSNPDCSIDTTNHDTGLIINFDYVGWASLIPLKMVDLEDQGGGSRGYCEMWGTSEVLDPRAHATINLS